MAKDASKIDNTECENVLKDTFHGVLGMCRSGEPYTVPINHAYSNGRFYFHAGLSGKKFDFIRENPNVCYTVSAYYGNPDFQPTEDAFDRCRMIVMHVTAMTLRREPRDKSTESYRWVPEASPR